jgi:hypothetical protein
VLVEFPPAITMTPAYSLALACVALALLTSLVAVRMLVVRVGEMRRRRIHPQQIATSAQATDKLQSIQVSDNYRNLFEMPVMFYALCALLLATGSATAFFAAGAWLYVLLRCAHSVIHCTYNRVMHRFAVFATSFVVLLVMWVHFGLQVLQQGVA